MLPKFQPLKMDSCRARILNCKLRTQNSQIDDSVNWSSISELERFNKSCSKSNFCSAYRQIQLFTFKDLANSDILRACLLRNILCNDIFCPERIRRGLTVFGVTDLQVVFPCRQNRPMPAPLLDGMHRVATGPICNTGFPHRMQRFIPSNHPRTLKNLALRNNLWVKR